MNKKELLTESKAELIERARELELPGRSQMTKEELAGEIAKALTRATSAARTRRTRKVSATAHHESKPTATSARRSLEARARKGQAMEAENEVENGEMELDLEQADVETAVETKSKSQPAKAASPSRASRNKMPPGGEHLDQAVDLDDTSRSSTMLVKRPAAKRAPITEDRLSGQELPKQYGKDKFVLLTRDPRWLFAYWEITPTAEEDVHRTAGTDIQGAVRVLRVYDCTGMESSDANTSFDVQIHPGAKSWYIHLPTEGRAWRVELGYIGRSGRFYRIFRSNTVATPRKSVSPVIADEFRELDTDFQEIFKLSGGDQVAKGLQGFGGSAAGRKKKRPEFEEAPPEWEYEFNLPTSGSLSSRMPSSPMGIGQKKVDDFFFWVNTELILYGGTQPDATVTVQGKKVQLRPDGTFTLRYALPDGTVDMPCVAVRADGKQKRKARPVVKRNTTY
ncbi:MAG: DUF4912 domain-containing protein [Candidatus Hydrogenedentota bacterium]